MVITEALRAIAVQLGAKHTIVRFTLPNGSGTVGGSMDQAEPHETRFAHCHLYIATALLEMAERTQKGEVRRDALVKASSACSTVSSMLARNTFLPAEAQGVRSKLMELEARLEMLAHTETEGTR